MIAVFDGAVAVRVLLVRTLAADFAVLLNGERQGSGNGVVIARFCRGAGERVGPGSEVLQCQG